LEYLISHFPHVGAADWRSRFERGKITQHDGACLKADAVYRRGTLVFYEREVEGEPESQETHEVLFRNSEILVADKPHGMPVTPAGNYLQRSLLYRLQQATGVRGITPLHRLDRDTAGLVLFSLNPLTRGHYHKLFAEGEIAREYLAIAPWTAPVSQNRWRLESRIGPGDPWFRQRLVDGPANAVTEIELHEAQESRGLFRLKPRTGKKHQLRLHMASIGAAIEGDRLYPCLLRAEPQLRQLQLLALRLAFIDP
jgi:tRNA pseudouridine32 synthase/23S rRNA pseudouridine746 synthase